MEELDLSKELQEFYEKNKDNNLFRNLDVTLQKCKGFLAINWLEGEVIGDAVEDEPMVKSFHNVDDFLFSFSKNDLFYYKTFLLIQVMSGLNLKFLKIDYANYNNIELEKYSSFGVSYLRYKFRDFKGPQAMHSDESNEKSKLFLNLHSLLKEGSKERMRIEAEKERLKEKERLEKERLKEQRRLANLNEYQDNILKELDKDGNGEVDLVEGNDFSLLLKKHQKSIIEIDRTYVQQFVKVSSYLKTKKNNVQLIFNSIKDTSNEKELNEYVGILKNEIHSYSLILFNSLNMIVSLVEDDMITFYEIHDSFDKLNIFNSNWESEVSQKLSNIGDGLSDLMYSIEEMGENIAFEIGHLSSVTEESNQMVSKQLEEIDSSLKFNNLLTGIQTYQMYKINKNTKGLRE